MRLRVTAPVEYDWEWRQVGDIIDVDKQGLIYRLLHSGQAVLAEPETEPTVGSVDDQPKEGDNK